MTFDNLYISLTQRRSEGETYEAIAADYDQRFDALFREITQSLTATLGCHELRAPGRPEERAAMLNDRADIPTSQRHGLAGNQTLEAVTHTECVEIPLPSSADHGTDCGVHSRGIATAGQDSNLAAGTAHHNPAPRARPLHAIVRQTDDLTARRGFLRAATL